ncbi:hypothetical protein QP270_25315, partial [Escherichia coli]|nr:hypothetical protein [Escherichia coli]MDK7248836.1 hypothetical protein [Corynebacterium amycolatum]
EMSDTCKWEFESSGCPEIYREHFLYNPCADSTTRTIGEFREEYKFCCTCGKKIEWVSVDVV